MPDFTTLATFLVAAFAICILPGSAVSSIISAGLARGFKAAMATELGVQIGRFAMVLLVALALELVRTVINAAFDWLKYAGAAYLAYLGLKFLFSGPSLTLGADRERSFARHVLSGFIVTWTNPKAFLFFGAFLPQFVNPAFPALPQVLFYGLLEMLIAAVTDTGYALLAVFARDRLGGVGARWLYRVSGVVLVAAAVWLATQHR